MGLGMVVTVAPLTTTVMNAVGPGRAGVASGVNNAVSRVGGLIAIALMRMLMVHMFNRELDRRSDTMHLPPKVAAALDAERPKLGAALPPAGASRSEQRAIRDAVAGSFVAGFRALALVAAGLALASAATAALTIPGLRRAS